MNPTVRPAAAAPAEPRTPEQDAAIKAAGAWISQLARTLKTCRLYEARNPTVMRFRNELGIALKRLLDGHGPIRYRFTGDDVLCEDVSLYPARSREDNLALAFYRDGVRAITFMPGIDMLEAEHLLDCLLQVTGQNLGDDDLITLLWEAQLPHLEVDYVPAEGDAGLGTVEDDGAPLLPWPTAAATDESQPEEPIDPAAGAEITVSGHQSRSDDWNAGDQTVEIEAGYEELQALAPSEVARFQSDYRAEHEVPTVTATLALAQAYISSGIGAEDRSELARFLPRVLRDSVARGLWVEAREALVMLRECASTEWSPETFVQEMLQPISISTTVELLDQQDSMVDYLDFARELSEPAVDWLNLVLAELQNKHHRLALAEEIAHLCRDNPERLAPWISDPRWFVVRNIVHILGWIGGPGVVGLLQSAARHPEPRVRLEVVNALGRVDLKLGRPILIRLLNGADARTLSGALHQLSGERDPTTARLVLRMLQDSTFEQRPAEEKRAILLALSGLGGDEVVPDLEAELHRGNWFSPSHDEDRQSIARVLARIGTPLAKAVLERGVQSKRAPVRIACEQALTGMGNRG